MHTDTNSIEGLALSPISRIIHTLNNLIVIDELADTHSTNLSLKTLLYLIGRCEISSDHQKIREALHRAMSYLGHGDSTTYPLYDIAVVNLFYQEELAKKREEEKSKEDSEREAREKQIAEQHRVLLEKSVAENAEIQKARLELYNKDLDLQKREEENTRRWNQNTKWAARLKAREKKLKKLKSNL
jgi:hypothetical protein